jgi:hypothetical protein
LICADAGEASTNEATSDAAVNAELTDARTVDMTRISWIGRERRRSRTFGTATTARERGQEPMNTRDRACRQEKSAGQFR